MAEKNLPIVRVAVAEDKKDFYRLWKICFGDSDAFCNWFFEYRFCPEYSVVLEAEAEIASCMQSFPYTVWIRGKEIPAAMLCGVSTHPEQRKKGFMGKIFSYEMNHLRQMGCAIAPHTPAVLPSYFSFGHYPVADALYLESEQIPEIHGSEKLVFLSEKDWEMLFPLYESFAESYSGIIKRTKADFLRKASDYAADGGVCAAYIENGDVKGYTFYYKMDGKLLCVEIVAADDYWESLLQGLFTQAEGCAFSAKLPPELYFSIPFVKMERKQKGVMGLCDLTLLLKCLKLEIPYGCKVTDSVVPENNGCFDFKGNMFIGEPVFEISAGHFLQVLVGYHSLRELRKEIQIFDEAKFEQIDLLLPKQNCYIIDEY